MSIEALFPGKPRRREWSGLWGHCPLCGGAMDMVIRAGREVYECGPCLESLQLELFA